MMRMRSSGEYSSTIRLRAGSAFAHGGHQTPVNTSMTVVRADDRDDCALGSTFWARTVTAQDPSEAVHVAVSGALSPGWSPGTEIGLLIASPEGLETLMRTEKAPAAAVPPFSTETEMVTVSPAVTLEGLTIRLEMTT